MLTNYRDIQVPQDLMPQNRWEQEKIGFQKHSFCACPSTRPDGSPFKMEVKDGATIDFLW